VDERKRALETLPKVKSVMTSRKAIEILTPYAQGQTLMFDPEISDALNLAIQALWALHQAHHAAHDPRD
jgi:hypothetical protein